LSFIKKLFRSLNNYSNHQKIIQITKKLFKLIRVVKSTRTNHRKSSCACLVFTQSPSVADGVEVFHSTPRFVRDTSKYWYKPGISREEGECQPYTLDSVPRDS